MTSKRNILLITCQQNLITQISKESSKKLYPILTSHHHHQIYFKILKKKYYYIISVDNRIEFEFEIKFNTGIRLKLALSASAISPVIMTSGTWIKSSCGICFFIKLNCIKGRITANKGLIKRNIRFRL